MNNFFKFNNALYNYGQVVRVEPDGGGAKVTFADGFILTMTVQEAQDIFQF